MVEPIAPAPRGDDAPIEPDEIQFDQAEYATAVPSGPTCGVCQRAIVDDYYELGGKVFCSSCRQGIETSLRGGSRVGRFLRASFLGVVAAVIGAVIYYAILRTTGLNIGLVAILVGAMVGGAVRKGTGNRGGRVYQLLAVFLTYSAIVAMYVPLVLQGMAKAAKEDQQARLAADKVVTDAAKSQAPPRAPAIVATAPTGSKAGDQAGPTVAPAASAKEPAKGPKEKIAAVENGAAVGDKTVPGAINPKAVLVALLVFLIVLIGISYALPVQIAIHAPISGLIFGFALWEAWKINKGIQLSFNGPFRVSSNVSDEPVSEVDDGG